MGYSEHLAILLALVDSGQDGRNEFLRTEVAHLSEGRQSQAPAVGPGPPVSSHPQVSGCPSQACGSLSSAAFHPAPSATLSRVMGLVVLSLDVELNLPDLRQVALTVKWPQGP